jgi:hypothetical protein
MIDKGYISMLLISIVLLIFVGYNEWNLPGAPADLQGVTFLPSVKGCAETSKGMVMRSSGEVGEGAEVAPSITVSGNEMTYYEAINHQCCREVKFTKSIQGNVINIYETWSGDGCKCMCFSELSVKTGNVPTGVYTVNVYSDETKTQQQILSQEITVK